MKYSIAFFCTILFSFSACKKSTDSTDACAKPGIGYLSDIPGHLEIGISGSNDFYEIEYGPNGFSRGGGTTITSTNYQQLTLTNGTYDFYVRGNCGGAVWSNWYGPRSIFIQNGTPPVTCFVPGNLRMSSPFYGLFWDASNASIYEMEYGVTGFLHGQGTVKISNGTGNDDISLAAGNTYEFYVRGICSPGDTSQWAGPFLYYANSNWNMYLPPINLTATRTGCCTLETSFDGNGETSFETAINTFASTNGATTFLTTSTSGSYSLGSSSTRYFYVRSICKDGSKTAWAGPITVN